MKIGNFVQSQKRTNYFKKISMQQSINQISNIFSQLFPRIIISRISQDSLKKMELQDFQVAYKLSADLHNSRNVHFITSFYVNL